MSCGRVLVPHLLLQAPQGTLQPWMSPPLGLDVTLNSGCIYLNSRWSMAC